MIVQQIEDPVSYWLHANLHREEGGLDNAKYWYHRAVREYTKMDIEEERQQILTLLKVEKKHRIVDLQAGNVTFKVQQLKNYFGKTWKYIYESYPL